MIELEHGQVKQCHNLHTRHITAWVQFLRFWRVTVRTDNVSGVC